MSNLKNDLELYLTEQDNNELFDLHAFAGTLDKHIENDQIVKEAMSKYGIKTVSSVLDSINDMIYDATAYGYYEDIIKQSKRGMHMYNILDGDDADQRIVKWSDKTDEYEIITNGELFDLLLWGDR